MIKRRREVDKERQAGTPFSSLSDVQNKESRAESSESGANGSSYFCVRTSPFLYERDTRPL